jgi:hypothetical protein
VPVSAICALRGSSACLRSVKPDSSSVARTTMTRRAPVRARVPPGHARVPTLRAARVGAQIRFGSATIG